MRYQFAKNIKNPSMFFVYLYRETLFVYKQLLTTDYFGRSTYRGCRYVLTRGSGRNRLATLKRVPTAEEYSNFDISEYESGGFKPSKNRSSETDSITVGAMTSHLHQDVISGLIKDLGNVSSQ